MTQIITAGRACVVHENKLLLVSSDGSFWHVPGGHMEPHESVAECAKREVYEETGYGIDVQNMLYVFEYYDKHWDTHKVECIFRASVATQPTVESWEDLGHDKSVTSSQWFTLEDIQARDDIQPSFIKEGKWLKQEDNGMYRGYEKSK